MIMLLFLKGLFDHVQALSASELNWIISNLDFIPVDKGDFIGGVPNPEMEQLYNFQKRISDEHTVIVTHNDFMDLLKNIKTVYEGRFEVLIRGKQLKIKILDGDIIEVEGEIEDDLIFAPPRQEGLIPVIKHAQFNGW